MIITIKIQDLVHTYTHAHTHARAVLQVRRLRDQRGKERQHERADERNDRHALLVGILAGHRVRCGRTVGGIGAIAGGGGGGDNVGVRRIGGRSDRRIWFGGRQGALDRFGDIVQVAQLLLLTILQTDRGSVPATEAKEKSKVMVEYILQPGICATKRVSGMRIFYLQVIDYNEKDHDE